MDTSTLDGRSNAHDVETRRAAPVAEWTSAIRNGRRRLDVKWTIAPGRRTS